MSKGNPQVNLESIQDAAAKISGRVLYTACQKSETLSRQLGCELYIKFENQQFTASFKERGALNRLLYDGAANNHFDGVIAMSAGNHAQALAYHGSELGIQTTIVMPRSTPNAKVEATRVFGAQVILHGATFDETRQFTEALAEQQNLELIHPFDDPLVIAGQGTVGLEVMQQVENVDYLVVPVGGGGLIGGVACATKAQSPKTQVLGVQMERFAGAHAAFHKNSWEPQGPQSTVAEGIAVKQPGVITSDLIARYVDEFHLVNETEVEQAIFDLLEIEKTVSEGAGAATLALVRRNREQFCGKRVVVILSGGNIDMMILSSVLQRGLVRSHRLVRMQVEIPDTPGALAQLTTQLGALDSNIMDIAHHRAFGGSSVRATLVEVVLQLRGEEQQDTVYESLTEAGYDLTFL
ncbi:MAG: threonine ammonia-lyase [Pseudomonadota bacterium]